ncbi:putative NADP-dependent oxidoreductase [Cladorrhinum samala]|uniref:Dehydrogenase FUB6 n=1 Tax=Cladorrhinum samala TaxID=585594 RepID=A0AAV9HEG2_9PEZI|nr:putative NADP-dependent oxidoreductase [Cladorrhinum samala]
MPHQLVLASRPTGSIIPGETFKLVEVPAPTEADVPNGHLLLESLYISMDPAMRGWLDDVRSYLPPVQIDEVMRASTVCRVIVSKSPKFKAGQIVTCVLGIREYGILPESQVENPFPFPPGSGLRASDLLGVLGMTGLTAWVGMTKIGQPKPGETVVVSAAAGATGSVAAQIAKIAGARVIGIAGGADKCRWLKQEVGLDVALDYKAPDFKKKLREATPNFVDVYFDNVGGEILDLTLARANKFARFAICGAISQYNSRTKQSALGQSFFNIITQRVRMEGFIVLDHVKEFPKALSELSKWVAEGKLKRMETVVKGGVKAAEGAMLQLFEGKNLGKLVVEVKNPEQDSAKL